MRPQRSSGPIVSLIRRTGSEQKAPRRRSSSAVNPAAVIDVVPNTSRPISSHEKRTSGARISGQIVDQAHRLPMAPPCPLAAGRPPTVQEIDRAAKQRLVRCRHNGARSATRRYSRRFAANEIGLQLPQGRRRSRRRRMYLMPRSYQDIERSRGIFSRSGHQVSPICAAERRKRGCANQAIPDSTRAMDQVISSFPISIAARASGSFSVLFSRDGRGVALIALLEAVASTGCDVCVAWLRW